MLYTFDFYSVILFILREIKMDQIKYETKTKIKKHQMYFFC